MPSRQNRLIPIFAPLQQRMDSHQDYIEDEDEQEALQSGSDVFKLHVSGSGDALSDLDRKRYADQHGEYVKERDHDGQAVLCEKGKERVKNEQHDAADYADHDEVQLLIGIVIAVQVVQVHQLIVDFRDVHDQ